MSWLEIKKSKESFLLGILTGLSIGILFMIFITI
jgi:hypothetical protein